MKWKKLQLMATKIAKRKAEKKLELTFILKCDAINLFVSYKSNKNTPHCMYRERHYTVSVYTQWVI